MAEDEEDQIEDEQIDATWTPIPYPPWTGSHLPGLGRRLRRFQRKGFKKSQKSQVVAGIVLAVAGLALFASPRLLALTPLAEILSPAGVLMLFFFLGASCLLLASRWMRLVLYSPFKPPASLGGQARRRRLRPVARTILMGFVCIAIAFLVAGAIWALNP
jgi:hypothetical protein